MMTTDPVVELDRWMPTYAWHSRHAKVVPGTPTGVSGHLAAVTVGELRIAAPLFAVRLLPTLLFGKRPRLAARRDIPVWDAMVQAGFLPLAGPAEPVSVLGFVGRPWQLRLDQAVRRDVGPDAFASFAEPAYVKGVTGTTVRPHADGAVVVTETRVVATDSYAARRFSPYWRLIEPFSGLTRRDMLAAVDRRARTR